MGDQPAEPGQQQKVPSGESILADYYLDHIICKVKILPQKHKQIKNPVHFYGELVKTKKGTEYLRLSRHVPDFRTTLLSPTSTLIEKRAVLWALGHIGSHDYGIKLILENDLIQPIVNLAENAEFLSLRGTCIYVIGMFCNTKDGKREVRKHNWIASETRGMSTVCLPK